jgi:hypothetical protein
MTELLVLAADKNIEAAIEGLLNRPKSLGLRPVKSSKILVHPRRDPAVFRDCHQFLRSSLREAEFCLVIFDREGCGDERPRHELEAVAQCNLDSNGWQGRSSVVAIDPEVESWVWSDSHHVDRVLGWPCADAQLREWLVETGFLRPGEAKPGRPKEAVEAALRYSRTVRSSALYKKLAQNVSVDHCTDPAFQKLRRVLAEWFPAD